MTDSAERFSATLAGVPAARSRAASCPPSRPANGADDQPIDLAHQPVALGGGQERARRDKPSIGFVGEPDERLVVGDGAAGELDDRLEVQRESSSRSARRRRASHGRGCSPALEASALCAREHETRRLRSAGSRGRAAPISRAIFDARPRLFLEL